jgi:hypothetical protein
LNEKLGIKGTEPKETSNGEGIGDGDDEEMTEPTSDSGQNGENAMLVDKQ